MSAAVFVVIPMLFHQVIMAFFYAGSSSSSRMDCSQNDSLPLSLPYINNMGTKAELVWKSLLRRRVMRRPFASMSTNEALSAKGILPIVF